MFLHHSFALAKQLQENSTLNNIPLMGKQLKQLLKPKLAIYILILILKLIPEAPSSKNS
jgi:hypothetical protein